MITVNTGNALSTNCSDERREEDDQSSPQPFIAFYPPVEPRGGTRGGPLGGRATRNVARPATAWEWERGNVTSVRQETRNTRPAASAATAGGDGTGGDGAGGDDAGGDGAGGDGDGRRRRRQTN